MNGINGMNDSKNNRGARLPKWMRRPMPSGASCVVVHDILKALGLATVCSSARCPNIGECFSRGTATFMILGENCTRSCRFCAVNSAPPTPIRKDEPQAVAEACVRLNLKHVVITSVTRDDLPDGGAGYFAKVCHAIHERLPQATIEILTPDFQGSTDAIDLALTGRVDVFNHNVETVPRLYESVRPQADYRQSLFVLDYAKKSQTCTYTKSGLMVGLGERPDEILDVMRDLRGVNCNVLTIGQYISPSDRHLPVERFVRPEEFVRWKAAGKALGFKHVWAGPFVRSSYRAERLFEK